MPEDAKISIIFTPTDIKIELNDAALVVGNAKLTRALHIVRKEIHRTKRAKAHEVTRLENIEKAKQAEKDARVTTPPLNPTSSVNKITLPTKDPLKRTVPPTAGLKKVVSATTLTKQEKTNA